MSRFAFAYRFPVHGLGNNGAIRIAQCVLGIEIEKIWTPSAWHVLFTLLFIFSSQPFSLLRLVSAHPHKADDPPTVSAALIGIVAALAIVVIAANVWYFKYRKQQVLFRFVFEANEHFIVESLQYYTNRQTDESNTISIRLYANRIASLTIR